MTEENWLVATDTTLMCRFLSDKVSKRKMRLFFCACCLRVYNLLSSENRRRVSRMASYYLPEPGVDVGDVWDVARQAVDVTMRFADGKATDKERQHAAAVVEAVSRHFGNIAAGAPGPGEDPNYDDAAVKMGSDAMAAADAAACLLPATTERAVRVAAVNASYDNEAYYAGAHDYPDFEPNHPHLMSRRAEQAAQCNLIRDIFGNPFRPINGDPAWLTETVVALAEGIYAERAFDRMPILADALEDAGCDNADVLNHCRQPGEHVRGCWVVDLLTGRK